MRFLGALLLIAFAPAALAQQTTRIETRPYYGAVVTIEQGVRVYRPVPPTTHLIVNPDGTTPLQINVGSATSVQRPSAATKNSSDR